MKIELTPEQVDLLTKDAEKKLIDEFNAAKAKLEKKLEEDIAALKGKFRFAEENMGEKEDKPARKKGSTRAKIDTDKLNELLASGKSYQEIADELGMTEGAVKVAAKRLRERLGQLIRKEVRQTLTNPDDFEAELKYLIELLRHA